MSIGARIEARRKVLGMTQEELAAAIGTNQKQISRWENGDNSPTAESIEAIAAALDLYPAQLFNYPSRDVPSPQEIELLNVYRALNTEQRRRLIAIARILGE